MWRIGFCLLAICLFAEEKLAATTNIACVGDSITFGYGLSSSQTYPSKLQKLLGTGFSVTNCGVSGTTLLKSGDSPYWNTAKFTASHANPNVVVIMLGSNDSKPVNWQYGSNFVSDYRDLIATYTNLPSHPRILICTPPPVFGSGNFEINPGIVATNIVPAVRGIGANLEVEAIDVFNVFAGHNEWFSDNVHPNSTGTTVLAGSVCCAILGDTSNGTRPSVEITRLGAQVVLNWPANAAGWVLQSATSLATQNLWTVVNQPVVNNGGAVWVTNGLAGSKLFRLWRPLQ